MNTPLQAGKGTRILVVDDDPISRELVALLLDAVGHRVSTAASGDDALTRLALASPEQQPAAILVDLNMPGISGTELACRLRGLAGGGVRILAMSASAPPSTEPSWKPPFDGFLLKPVSPELLDRMLASDPPAALPPSLTPGSSLAADSSKSNEVLNEVVYTRLEKMMPRVSLQEVFDVCIEDVRKRIPEMAESLRREDIRTLRQAAHIIKGGSSMIGAARLSQIAAKIEQGQYAPGDDRESLKQLSSACDELEDILRERNAGKHR